MGTKSKIISICNQKGGVGKTTSSINIAACLREKGYKVLLIDFDPQGSMTEALKIKRNDENNITKAINFFMKFNRKEAAEVLGASIFSFSDRMDVLPSHFELSCLEQVLVSVNAREFILKKLLSNIKDHYDYIIIDCPPTFSVLTINALVASNYVLIPVKAQFLDFKGFNLLYKNLRNYIEDLNEDLSLLGVFQTFYDSRLKMSKKVDNSLRQVKEQHSVAVLNSKISQSTVAAEASLAGRAIIDFSKGSKIAKEYVSLTEEILRKIKEGANNVSI